MAGVDLSGLDDFNTASFLEATDFKAAIGGHPMMIPLDQIAPDPNQPRQEFDAARLKELAASIKERGVKSPISVKPQNEEGLYIINHGERRFRAADLAGLTEIPAFIDGNHTGYDQVIENIQRDGLTPLEIAHFIERCLEGGDKKGDIARMLGKPASYISDHSVFFKLPECVRELYDASRCRDIQALAALHRAFKKFPAEVESFCRGERTVSQTEVKAFIAALKEREAQPPEPEQVESQEAPAEVEEKEVSVSELTAGTAQPVAGSAKPASPAAENSSEDSGEDLEATLYEQLERLLDPLESYLKEVTDPEFRAAAVTRLQEIAGKFSK